MSLGFLMILNSIILSTSSVPHILVMVLLLQSMCLSVLSYFLSEQVWFSYMIFLIMVGGLLVMFIYLSSLMSNKKVELSSILNLKFIFILPFLFLFNLTSVHEISFLKNNFIVEDVINLMCFLNMKIYLFLVIYLLISLFVIVSVMKKSNAPLRLLTFFVLGSDKAWQLNIIS
uniref:NADH dehydrogenase subunit 6 n=1 Tax=Dimorphostylis asiatica TaxID=2840398 RepID=A0A8F8FFQ6_9CRUS|nr:NADH dehydrogenase subunit 6 [Dimorphostylis asiatica]